MIPSIRKISRQSYAKVKSALNNLEEASSEFKEKAHQHNQCFCDNFINLDYLSVDINSIEEDL